MAGRRDSQAAKLTTPSPPVFREPVGYHFGKGIIPKVSPVNDAESTVIKRFAGDDLQGAPTNLPEGLTHNASNTAKRESEAKLTGQLPLQRAADSTRTTQVAHFCPRSDTP